MHRLALPHYFYTRVFMSKDFHAEVGMGFAENSCDNGREGVVIRARQNSVVCSRGAIRAEFIELSDIDWKFLSGYEYLCSWVCWALSILIVCIVSRIVPLNMVLWGIDETQFGWLCLLTIYCITLSHGNLHVADVDCVFLCVRQRIF